MSKYLLALMLIVGSWPLQAQFHLEGPFTITAAEGETSSGKFSFAFTKQQDGAIFQVGQQRLAVSEVPKRYTLSLILHKDGQVWVPDFSKQPLSALQWQIGSHQLKLYQQVQIPPQPGNMVLEVDGSRHVFIAKRPAQVHFLFNEDGIIELRVEGTVRQRR